MNCPENLSEYLEIITSSTKSELKILKSYLWFHKKLVEGNYKEAFPEREKIAEMSKCSVSSVRNFIKKYDGIIFSHENRRNFETGKQSSNLYHFNRDFMDHTILLEATGYLGRLINSREYILKNLKIHIWKEYIKNEDFMHEIIYRKGDLMNNKIAHGFYSKLPTIKSYILRTLSKDIVLHKVPDKQQKKETDWGPLSGLQLTESQKKQLTKRYSPDALSKAVKDYYFKRTEEPIKNLGGFIWRCAKLQTMKSMAS